MARLSLSSVALVTRVAGQLRWDKLLIAPSLDRPVEPTPGRTFLLTATALWLLLVGPFVVLLDQHHYSLLRPEIALAFGIAAALAIVAAGLARRPILHVLAIACAFGMAMDAQFDALDEVELTVVIAVATGVGWMLRRHLATIVALAGVTFLVSTVILARPAEPDMPSLAGGNEARPFVLHVVLDEHVGVRGMPRGLPYDGSAKRMSAFFDRYHFRRFTDAFSEYFWTRYSLSQILNFSNGRYTPGLFRIGDGTRFELVKNEYFSRVAAQGYAVNVFQTSYVDLCSSPRTAVRCETYDFAGLRELQYAQMSWETRFYAVSAAYVRRLAVYDELRRVGRFLRNRASRGQLPDWAAGLVLALPPIFSRFPPEHYAAIATSRTAQRVTAAVSRARRGQYVFAHLMWPHYPYVFRPDCSIRPAAEWTVRTDSDAPRPASNTSDGRAARYVLYLEQLECVYKEMDRLLEAIPAELRGDAVVIVHGDHGSRINITDPDADREHVLKAADFSDAYSTVFAVKGPTIPPGDDPGRVAIGCVLTALVNSGFRSASPDPTCNAGHTVFKVPPEGRELDAEPVAIRYAP